MGETVALYRPRCALRIDGSTAPEATVRSLVRWRVAQHLSQAARCELLFVDPDPTTFEALRLGTSLALADDDDRTIFTGSVTHLRREKRADGLRALAVRAEDALAALRRAQAVAVRGPGSLAAIARQLAADAGLAVRTLDDGPDLPMMIQWGVDDLAWLARLGATFGRYFVLAGDELRLMTLQGWTDPAVELDPAGALYEASIEASSIGLRTAATATAWNPADLETFRSDALDLTLEEDTAWPTAAAFDPAIGRDLVGGAGPHSEGAVTAVAVADLDRAAKRAHCFRGLAHGDPRLRPGTRIRLTGDDEQLRGEFVLTRVEHCFTAEAGYTCELSSLPPAAPRQLTGPPVSLGVVSDTADPADAGRVRVRLKAFRDTESDWLNVCAPAAGPDKGLIAQPETGDSVLVAFVNANPAQGIVLSGLFGAAGPHDRDVARERPRPYSLRTAGGQTLRLDDQHGAVRLSSRGGELALHPEGVVLRADAPLEISAPGQRITIVADRIDFRRG